MVRVLRRFFRSPCVQMARPETKSPIDDEERCSCPPRLRRTVAKGVDALSDNFQNGFHFESQCLTPPRLRPPRKNQGGEPLARLSFHENAEASAAEARAEQNIHVGNHLWRCSQSVLKSEDLIHTAGFQHELRTNVLRVHVPRA